MNRPATQQIVSIDFDLVNNLKVLELKKNKRFSELINNLLRAYLGVEAESIPDKIEELDKELFKLEAKKALILEKKTDIEKNKPTLTEQEKADGWVLIDGVKYKTITEFRNENRYN